MKLDGETIQELYKRGILTEKSIRVVNIWNHYELLKSQGIQGAAIKTANKFGITKQKLNAILNKYRK